MDSILEKVVNSEKCCEMAVFSAISFTCFCLYWHISILATSSHLLLKLGMHDRKWDLPPVTSLHLLMVSYADGTAGPFKQFIV